MHCRAPKPTTNAISYMCQTQPYALQQTIIMVMAVPFSASVQIIFSAVSIATCIFTVMP